MILAIDGIYNSRSDALQLWASFSPLCALMFPPGLSGLQRREVRVGEGAEAAIKSPTVQGQEGRKRSTQDWSSQ